MAGDLALQAFIVVLGLALFFNPHTLVDPINLGTSPTWGNLVFALTIAVIAFTSLESASGLAGEVRIGRARPEAHGRQHDRDGRVPLRRDRAGRRDGAAGRQRQDGTAPASALNAPMIGVVEQVHPHWLQQTLDLPGRGARRDHAAGRGQLGDARPLAPGLLALDQPPDPQRARPAAPGALHALCADHPRRRPRRGPGRSPRTSTSWSASTPSGRRSPSRSPTSR